MLRWIGSGLVFLLFAGCTNVVELQRGQCMVNETQVEGVDLSIPVPFVEGVYLLNLRFGLIQNKLFKGNGVVYESTSDFDDLSLLQGKGSIKRTLKVDGK